MTDVVNHVNFEKCTLPKRDEAIDIRKENAEKHIYNFDFTEMLNIVANKLAIEPISTEEHPSFTIPLYVFDEYLEAINIKRSEWMGIVKRLANVLQYEYGYDAYIIIKKSQVLSDTQELFIKL